MKVLEDSDGMRVWLKQVDRRSRLIGSTSTRAIRSDPPQKQAGLSRDTWTVHNQCGRFGSDVCCDTSIRNGQIATEFDDDGLDVINLMGVSLGKFSVCVGYRKAHVTCRDEC